MQSGSYLHSCDLGPNLGYTGEADTSHLCKKMVQLMIWLHHLVGTTLVNLEDIEKMCEHCRTIHVNSAHLASWSSYEPRKVEWRPID